MAITNEQRINVQKLHELWNITVSAYRRGRDEYLHETYPSRSWSSISEDLTEEEAREWAVRHEGAAVREEIGKRYIQELCKLPTDILEDIVKADACGAQKRDLLTIGSLLNELARRGLLSDSQETTAAQ